MRWLRNLPIQWKLALVTVLTSAFVELLAISAVLIYTNQEYRREKVQEFAVEAQVLAANLTAPLAFGDTDAAHSYLNSLSANDQISAAGVYDTHGALFAFYKRANSPYPLPRRAQTAGESFKDQTLTVSWPIKQKNTSVGSLTLMVNTDTFSAQLLRFLGGFAFFAILGSLAIAVPIALRLNADITTAIREVADAAARVKVGDLDFELPSVSRQDEIGTLTTTFTQMVISLRETLQQERLRALGQMSSGIAHDINNVLTPLTLHTQSLLETERNASPRVRAYLETVRRVTADIAATVARMRDFSRPRGTELTLAPVDLNNLVRQVYDLTRVRWSDMQQQMGTVIEGRMELAENLPVVMGIEGEIREALTNLIFNAVDAMPKGGTLSLRTVSLGNPPTHVAVDVIDTGMGMDEATRQRCFEPFYTTKGERGTGLGMAMVYGAIKRHSAEIAVESAPDVGTSIRLIFLAHTAVPAPERSVAVLPSRGLRILIVDDNPSVLESLSINLELDGHQVMTAKGGQAALETLRGAREGNSAFEVVITDFGMPHIDGGQVARAVKELSPSTSTILLSGWGRRMLEQGEVPKYVDHILAKPPELDELRAALAQCC